METASDYYAAAAVCFAIAGGLQLLIVLRYVAELVLLLGVLLLDMWIQRSQ